MNSNNVSANAKDPSTKPCDKVSDLDNTSLSYDQFENNETIEDLDLDSTDHQNNESQFDVNNLEMENPILQETSEKIQENPFKILTIDVEKLTAMINERLDKKRPNMTETKENTKNEDTDTKDEEEISFEDAAMWAANQKKNFKIT